MKIVPKDNLKHQYMTAWSPSRGLLNLQGLKFMYWSTLKNSFALKDEGPQSSAMTMPWSIMVPCFELWKHGIKEWKAKDVQYNSVGCRKIWHQISPKQSWWIVCKGFPYDLYASNLFSTSQVHPTTLSASWCIGWKFIHWNIPCHDVCDIYF